jgi:hypothetical protein
MIINRKIIMIVAYNNSIELNKKNKQKIKLKYKIDFLVILNLKYHKQINREMVITQICNKTKCHRHKKCNYNSSKNLTLKLLKPTFSYQKVKQLKKTLAYNQI